VVEPLEQLYCERQEWSGYADIEALEQEIGGLIGRLGALLMQKKLQEVVQSEAFQEQESALIKQLPGRWVSEGYREVTIRTGWGAIRVKMRYFRRQCLSAKARRTGIYPAQVLWGIIQGCTRGWALVPVPWWRWWDR